ncbi:MAG: arylamine N-acetyltransferase [candidate division Zixibacteria bacterium]|nr:arylamine N-acetyltransferase [candidate division Zixibacteria bacterium]
MTEQTFFKRYLALLKIRKRMPSYEALKELISAQMMRIPFENVSKLYYRNRQGLHSLHSLQQHLDGIEYFNYGGTCYSNNYFLHLLLEYLGYDVMLCGADMSEPDVHLVNIVSLDGREFLVDVGYAATFMEPLPLDLDQDYIISGGYNRYVLKPKNKNGNSYLELYQENQLTHGYMVKPICRKIEYFKQVIEESYQNSSLFMHSLLMVRTYPGRSIRIHNLSVIESEGAEYKVYQIKNKHELSKVIEEKFSISQDIVSEVIENLEFHED